MEDRCDGKVLRCGAGDRHQQQAGLAILVVLYGRGKNAIAGYSTRRHEAR